MRLEKLDLDGWSISYDKYACPLFPASLFWFFWSLSKSESSSHKYFLVTVGPTFVSTFHRQYMSWYPTRCILSVPSVVYSHIFDEQKYNFLPVEICQRISRIKQNGEKKWESYSMMVRSTMLPRMSVNTHELFFVSRYAGWETIYCCRW